MGGCSYGAGDHRESWGWEGLLPSWVSTGAALQLKKCEGKSKSDSNERDSGFQVFFQQNPKIFLSSEKGRRRFVSVSSLLNGGAVKELVQFSCHCFAQGGGSREALSLSS